MNIITRTNVIRFLGETVNGWMAGNFCALHDIAQRVAAGEDSTLTPGDRYDAEDVEIARDAFLSAVVGEFVVDGVRHGGDVWAWPMYFDGETLADFGVTVEDVSAVLKGDPKATAQVLVEAYTALRNGERGRVVPAADGCSDCGHDVNDHGGTGPCPLDSCQSFRDPVDERVEAWANHIKLALMGDVVEETIPPTVESWEDLNDHVDANDYLTDAGVPLPEDEDSITLIRAVQDDVNEWISSGTMLREIATRLQTRITARDRAFIEAYASGAEEWAPDPTTEPYDRE